MRVLLMAALLASGLALAEPGALLKDTELRARPFGDAEVLASLKAKEGVDILARKGAWANVQAGEKNGWVRLLNVRTGSGQRGDAGVGALASVFRTGSSGNTVSTGVKGLSEEKLKTAQPDADEARRLNQYKQSEKSARGFAKQAKLATQRVDYLQPGQGGNDE
ncbi:MAG: SH3 domain-containing protein [Pseudomonadota bacterium]